MSQQSENRGVTLLDVAKKAGVSMATASRSLRDDPATKKSTRDKVKKIAELIGYRPDPSLSRLAERRWHGKRTSSRPNIGYLYNGRSAEGKLFRSHYNQFCRVAERHGYALIDFDLSDFSNESKLIRRLSAQGVGGILVARLSEAPYELDDLCARHAL